MHESIKLWGRYELGKIIHPLNQNESGINKVLKNQKFT